MKSLLYLLALLVVALGGYFLYANYTRGTANDTSTYTSTEYGISFEYPNTYELQEREAGNAERFHHSITLIDKEALANIPRNGEGPPTINVDIFQNDLDKLPIETWVRGSNNSNFKLSPDGILASTTVAGAPALSYVWDGLYRGRSVVIEHKNNIIMLSAQYLTAQDKILNDFDRLLSSVAFN